MQFNPLNTLSLGDRRHIDERFGIGSSSFFILGYIQELWFATMAATFLT